MVTIRLAARELKEIEEFIRKGEVENIHDFIRYAVQNQLQLERERFEPFDYYQVASHSTTMIDEKSPAVLRQNKIRLSPKINLPAIETNNYITLQSSTVRERTKSPIWALKNRYFPMKVVLRVIQKMVSKTDNGKVSLDSLTLEIRKIATKIKSSMELLDERMDNKRGKRFATSFPSHKNNKSYDRFYNSFVIYISPDGNTIKGFPYEMGFIDIIEGGLFLTEDGNNFANIHSPILDGYLLEDEIPLHVFSNEELNFLYEHIKQKTVSEAILYKFMLTQLENDVNTPDDMNKKIRPFLEERFPKEKGYSVKTANSLRAGITSRMVELKLIEIEKMGGRSYYKINKNGHMFGEM